MSSGFDLEVVGALLQQWIVLVSACCMLLSSAGNSAVSMRLRPKRFVGLVFLLVSMLNSLMDLRSESETVFPFCLSFFQDLLWRCGLLRRLSHKKIP